MKGWAGADAPKGEDAQFETPRWLVESCVEQLELFYPTDVDMTVLDPCSGRNVWASTILTRLQPVRFHECEIQHGSDFYHFEKDVDWIVGNPPFSNLTKWLDHSTRIAQVGFAYILPAHALSNRRLTMIESFGFLLQTIHSFPNPMEWGLGYPHFFCVWTKRDLALMPSCHTVNGSALSGHIQRRLDSYGSA